jgi:hypothetical protein
MAGFSPPYREKRSSKLSMPGEDAARLILKIITSTE